MSETYTAAFERDGEGWMAEIAEEPRVRCSASSLGEARQQIREALGRWLKTDPAGLQIKDNVRFPAKFRATQESVRATRTENDKEEMMAKMTDPVSAKEWAEDMGIAERNPSAVEWLDKLEGVTFGIDQLCHRITVAEEISRWGELGNLAEDERATEESGPK